MEEHATHSLIPPTINVLILVGFLAYKLRGPLKKFVADRHSFLRDELERVGIQLRQARERFEEFSARLSSMEGEVTELRKQAKKDAQEMRTRLLADAKKNSESIVSDAHAASASMYTDLRNQLRTEYGLKVIDRAEELLRQRLTSDDQARIRKEFSRQVGGGVQ
jgi:F-type H+-transporting ATPase subunit b